MEIKKAKALIKEQIFKNSKLVNGKLAKNECYKCLFKHECKTKEYKVLSCNQCTRRCRLIDRDEREDQLACVIRYKKGRCFFELKDRKSYEEKFMELIRE